MIFFRKLHKWLGLVLCIQVLIWVVTGALISIVDVEVARGGLTRLPAAEKVPLSTYGPIFPISQLPIASTEVTSVKLLSLFSSPVYRVQSTHSIRVFDARTGLELMIDQQRAERIALASYGGEGELLSSKKLESGSIELRFVSGVFWQMQFNDALDTRVYVSAEDGRVIAHRNSRWRLVDFLLMLHFMDYARMDSINTPQIIVFAFGTLWLTISGVYLVFYSFGRNDFRWLRRKSA